MYRVMLGVCGVVAGLALAGAPSLAQQDDNAAAQEAAQSAAEQGRAQQADAVKKKQPAAAKDGGQQVFVPSEEVSEDSSVSFPADI